MNERIKLAEAQYFYTQMCVEVNDAPKFTFNLSAFLSASRSVLQYALEEAKNKPNGQNWYDTIIRNSPVLSFFKDKRNINIHIEPVKPSKHVSITITENLTLSESVSLTVRDKDGNIIYKSPPQPKEQTPRKLDSSPVITVKYKFTNWTGTEDILTLSQMYIDELEKVVEEGTQKGFISG